MIGGGLHDGDHWSSHGIGYVDCHNHVDGVRMVLTLVNCGSWCGHLVGDGCSNGSGHNGGHGSGKKIGHES